MHRFIEKSRPFWISMFLTLIFFAASAGVITVDYRCRMMVDIPENQPVSFEIRHAGQPGGQISFRWFSEEVTFPLSGTALQRRILQEIPILIPRSVRIAACFLPLIQEKAALFSGGK